jgi:hypothetical protein
MDGAADDRRAQRQRGSSRLLKGPDDGEFDREFWRGIPPPRRLELVWDLDVWVSATPENAARVMAALRDFGAPLGGVSVADFARPGVTLQIGIAPNRIDVATEIDGVAFVDAWPNRVESSYGEQRIWVIGRRDLIENKRAAGRPQGLVDLELLKRHAP